MKKKRKWGRMIALTLYVFTVGFWTASGLKTAEIIQSRQYVHEAYAKELQLDEGRTVFYREAGNVSNPVMLFIHGFLGSSYDFIEVLEYFKATHHVIAVDLIGFGLSSKPNEYDYGKENQARTVLDFIEAKQLNDITLMAHSMGGEVSFHLTHLAPEKISQLILVGSAGYYPEGAMTNPPSLPLFMYREVVQNYFIQRTFFFTAYSEYERKNGLITNEDFDEMYVVNRTIPPNILKKFGEDNDSKNMQAILDTIHQPILLLWGEFDGFIPLATGELLLASLGDNAHLEMLPNAGHLPFDTFFEAFINHVEEFIT